MPSFQWVVVVTCESSRRRLGNMGAQWLRTPQSYKSSYALCNGMLITLVPLQNPEDNGHVATTCI
eukprot:3249084-Amphidinium_carterae.2